MFLNATGSDLHSFDASCSSSSVVGGVHGRPLLLQQRLRLLFKKKTKTRRSQSAEAESVCYLEYFTDKLLDSFCFFFIPNDLFVCCNNRENRG